MLYLAENLRKLRLSKELTQEDVANYLNITPQSVSKWERGETYPDITLLPALANIFETSIDQIIGMNAIRAEEARRCIHSKANSFMRANRLNNAEEVYREALFIYPTDAGMILGLASVLSLTDKTSEAIGLIEKGLSLSTNEKQKATMRATLCFLYLKSGRMNEANSLASLLPHKRECREIIKPIMENKPTDEEINAYIRNLILG